MQPSSNDMVRQRRAPIFHAASVRAALQRTSLWVVRFTDGRVISEWECDWLDLPRKGRRAIRLYSPHGDMAELDDGHDATGRLFQLKVGVMQAGVGSQRRAHLIGLVTATDGTCSCAAYETATGRIRAFTDNVHGMAYENLGALATDNLGLSRP